MSIDSRGARVTRRDVVDLATASERLVVVADTIRMSGVRWGEVSVNLLIAVNDVIVRLQTRGAACFARYLAKHPSEAPGYKAVSDGVAAPPDNDPQSDPEKAER